MKRRDFLKTSIVFPHLVAGCTGNLIIDTAESTGYPNAEPKSWSIIALPDTQFYSLRHPHVFKAQTEWIAANKDTLNIKYVLHLGDLTHYNSPAEWENAKAAMDVLDGKVPYALATGNHDYGNGSANNRQTLLNEYFKYNKYKLWPTFGGSMVEQNIENTFHLFEANGQKWLILALEWGPRNSVVAWADSILSAHRDRNVILITHAYLYHDGTRYNWDAKEHSQTWSPYSYGTSKDPDGTNDGEDIWEKVLKKHPLPVLTVNGHVLRNGVAYLKSSTDQGSIANQMLVNFQEGVMNLPRDGSADPGQTILDDGSLRVLQFHPDGKTVKITDYSPYRDYYAIGDSHQFTFHLQ